jgi:hypothetical protein
VHRLTLGRELTYDTSEPKWFDATHHTVAVQAEFESKGLKPGFH